MNEQSWILRLENIISFWCVMDTTGLGVSSLPNWPHHCVFLDQRIVLTASISDAYYLAPIHSSLSFKDTLPFLNQSLKRMCVWEREGESERQGEWETEIWRSKKRMTCKGQWNGFSCLALLLGYGVTGSGVYYCTLQQSRLLWEYLEMRSLCFSLKAKINCPFWSGRPNTSEGLEYISVNHDPAWNLTLTITENHA